MVAFSATSTCTKNSVVVEKAFTPSVPLVPDAPGAPGGPCVPFAPLLPGGPAGPCVPLIPGDPGDPAGEGVLAELEDGIGKLVLVNRKARMGRNPKTGESIKIPAKKVVKFRVAKAAKDAILGSK